MVCWRKVDLTISLPSADIEKVLAGDTNVKIINGEKAALGQFPHQAWLEIARQRTRVGCGGSLIGERWILTAAHCTIGGIEANVTLGIINRKNFDGQTYIKIAARNLITHENYNESGIHNDIALIELSETVVLNDNIKIVQLPTEEPTAGDVVTASGYGSTTDYGESANHDLMFVPLPILNRTSCFVGKPDPLKICVNTRGPIGVCSGDSGGPLNDKDNMSNGGVVYGIASYVVGPGCRSGPHVFTNVAAYLDWIKDNSGISPMV